MENQKIERDQLAGFHQTISQQLNARLAESPRFFWALVVVSTGYGYVLWNVANATKQDEPELRPVLILASLLSYVAVLWASWYLAALGYAFRYLQSGQHCIEHALGWDAYVPNMVNRLQQFAGGSAGMSAGMSSGCCRVSTKPM